MKAPRKSGALPQSISTDRSSGSLRVDHLAVAQRNLPRLLGGGEFPDQVDVQQAVLERRTLHLDEGGELKHAFERARRDALVEDFALRLGLRLLLTADGERALLGLDVDVRLGEAGDRDRNAI